MNRNIELMIVMTACIAPIFLLAGNINADEFMKSGIGIAVSGSVVGAYRMWLSREPRSRNAENLETPE